MVKIVSSDFRIRHLFTEEGQSSCEHDSSSAAKSLGSEKVIIFSDSNFITLKKRHYH